MSIQEPRQQFDKLQSFVRGHRQAILLFVFVLLFVGTTIEVIGNTYCTEKETVCWWTNDLATILNSLGSFIMFLQLILAFPDIVSSTPLQESAPGKTISRNI